MDRFRSVTCAQEIIFGPGCIEQLPEAVERFGWQRIMLCASPSLRRAGHIHALQAALASKLVATYDCTQSHVPDFQLAEALELAATHQVDAVIGLGGGSPIGLAKAVSLAFERRLGEQLTSPYSTVQPLIPVIAIPTTYAGSEMTPIYGVTHHNDGSPRKVTVTDSKVTPRLVIYDPGLTLDLPSAITASTGINALAHCIEAMYSIKGNPLSTAAAQSAIRRMVFFLPRCASDGSDLAARTEMLIASHLAAFALSMTAMGLHHGLCHVLGGSAAIPHGTANAIILPHAMRFNLEAAAPQLALVAEAMGFTSSANHHMAAEAAVDGVFEFIKQLGLPQRLRDVGVSEDRLAYFARLALDSRAVQDNPRSVTSAAQTEAVLRAAW